MRTCVEHKRQSRRKLSLDSEDYDTIQLSESDGKVSVKSEPGSEIAHNSQGRDEGPRAGSVDQGVPSMTPRRWITTGFVKRTMPQLSDRKHIIDTSEFGNSVYQKKLVTVFAPTDVTSDEIIRAMYPSYDGRFLCATSSKGDKYVYYPAKMHANECTCSGCNAY